jgi:hypothetical protein
VDRCQRFNIGVVVVIMAASSAVPFRINRHRSTRSQGACGIGQIRSCGCKSRKRCQRVFDMVTTRLLSGEIFA